METAVVDADYSGNMDSKPQEKALLFQIIELTRHYFIRLLNTIMPVLV